MIGRTLNHYRVLEKLGSGGMGEVYLAEDETLNRRIALKILPAEFAANPDRLGRFEREAKAVAALNHPNIVTIHSIEQSDPGDAADDAAAVPLHFLTMELVTGKTLAEIIPRRGLPLARLLEIGLALTDAIGTAHARGIVHRDLKPGNIMVDAAGRVKILDFGLSRFLETGSGGGDTEAATRDLVTEEGKVLGTVAYMSPEQAEGKAVDARSDVFSLGVLLYQMATGSRPFKGDTRISIISSILRETPTSITELNQDLPRHFGRIIKRCLAKEPGRRYPDAREVCNELRELKEELDSGELQPAAAATGRRRRGTPGIYVVGGMLVVAVAAAAYLSLGTRGWVPASGTGPPALRGAVTQLTDRPGWESQPTISPDGRTVLYVGETTGEWDIFLQRVEGERELNLTEGSGARNWSPAWSPDGETIAFNSSRGNGGIFLMGGMGESVRRLADAGFHPAWSPDGSRVVFSTEGFDDPKLREFGSELWTIAVETGERRKIRDADAIQPAWSPHGDRIAYWGLHPGSGQRDIWTVPAAGGEAVPVTDDLPTDWNPVWSPDGRYLYFASDRSGGMNLWRVPIEESTGQVRGPAQPVTSGSSEIGFFSIAGDGRRIVYQVSTGAWNIQRVGFDPATRALTGEPEWVTRGNRNLISPAVSPDGEWIAYVQWGNQEDLYVMRADGSDRRRLTDDLYKNRAPIWSPDGTRIGFFSDRSGDYEIWTIRPDGSDLRRLTDTPGRNVTFFLWSPDGTRMFVQIEDRSYLFDPRLPAAEQDFRPLPDWPEEGGRKFQPWDWSPDGERLAGTVENPDGEFDGFGMFSIDSGKFDRLSGPIEELGEKNVFGPLWIDNDLGFVFSSGSQMYFLDGNTGHSEVILSVSPDGIYLSSRTADRRTLYIDRGAYEADIWLLELE